MVDVVEYVHDVMEQNELVVVVEMDDVDDDVGMDYDDDDDVEVIGIEIGNDVFFYVTKKMMMIDYK